MKQRSTSFSVLLAVAFASISGIASAQTRVIYDVTADVDVADLLIIRGSEIQWHHPGSGATVGRHSGSDDPTTITAVLDGITNLDNFAWTPGWPEPPPAEIRYEAFSSIFTNLTPSLPFDSVTVNVSVIDGRGTATVQQFPDATNDWTLIVRFADGFAGAAFLTAEVSIEYVPLRIIFLDPTAVQLRWPTNAPSYQLESAATLPAASGDWTAVTNQAMVIGQDFALAIDATEPRKFFRLHKL